MKKALPVIGCLGLLSLVGCSFAPDEGKKLSIPYRAQEQYNYCTPAAVLMWRLYDGLPAVSQTSIFNWMGGIGCTNQLAVRDAVNYFTNTRDAYWDYGYASDYRYMVARQATAFDRSTPSIVVVRGNHVVVLTGGKWHYEGNYRVWDLVYVHDPDPSVGSHHPYSASEWLDLFCPQGAPSCEQILSSAAVASWLANFDTYGSSTKVYGSGRGGLDPKEY